MKKYLLILVCFLIAIENIDSQAFSMDIEIAPPYPTELDYYLENANNLFISITNNGGNNRDVYYHVRIVGDNGIDVFTTPTYKPGQPVSFSPFETKAYVGNDLQMDFPFSFPEDIDMTSLTPEQYDYISFYRALPEGTYELCVQIMRYDTDAVVSTECSEPFTVSYGDAPYIYMPYNNEDVPVTANSLVNIGWEPPMVSNPGVGVFSYTLEMIDITDDPFGDIELMFSNPGTYDILYDENLMATIYNYSFPPGSIELIQGHTYALRVRAIDMTGTTPLPNNGYSPISLFTYGLEDDDVPPPPPTPSDCGMPCVYTPSIPGVPATSIGGFDVLDIGNFRMSNVNFDNMDPLSASGTAEIELEFINGVSINVIFEDVSINTDGRIYDGEVTAVIDHEFDTDNMTPEEAQFYEDYLLAGRIMEELVGEDPIGLPVAFTQNVAGNNMMLGLNSISFTPTQATVSLIQNMHIPKLGFEGWAPMEGEEICLFPAGFGEAVLQPNSDITIPFEGGIDVIIEKEETSVALDCNGVQSVSLGGKIKFPEYTLVKEYADGTPSDEGAEGEWSIQIDEEGINGAIEDIFGSDGSPYESGFHFKAEIEMEPFRFAALPDWGTSPLEIYIDLSDYENPPNFQWPENYTSPHLSGNEMELTWHGAFMPGIEIYTPNNFMGLDESKTIDLQTVLIDPNVNFKASVQDFITFEEGNVDGWAVSVDELNIEIIQNTLSEAGFNGLLSIPITGEGEDFEYDALMSYGSNDTYADYTLTISSLEDITFPFAVARVDLSSNSYVSAMFNPGDPSQNAVEIFLEGGLAVESSIFEPNNQSGYAPQLQLPAVDFSLNYHSKNGFSNSHFGFSQPAVNPDFDPEFGEEYNKESFGGFPLNISDVYLTGSCNEVLFQLNPEITIASGEHGISVEGEIYVESKCSSGNKKKLEFEKMGLSELEVDAEAFGISLNGEIEFYENETGSTVTSGVRGDLAVGFPMGMEANLAADFGNQVSNPDAAYGTSQNFNYWFLDGMVYLPVGIPIGTSGLGVYGFGGGVYVNMTNGSSSLNNEEVGNTMDEMRNLSASSSTNNSVAPTGSIPTPEFDSYGLKIAGALGTMPEYMINMDLSIYGEFSSSLGLNMLTLSGDVYHLTSIADRGEGGLWSNAFFQWEKLNDNHHIYSGGLGVHLDMFALTGDPKNDFQVVDAAFFAESGGNNKWYFHAGDPREDNFGHLEFDLFPLPKITATGYFMAGHNLPNDLPVPEKVEAILGDPSTSDGDNGFDNPNPVSKNGEQRSDWDKIQSESASGLAFGASLEASAEIDAFLLYGRLAAFCGFDINITQDEKRTCYIEGQGDFAPGWNGWYARGQVYAGLEGAVGIEFRFCKKDYDIRLLELAAAIMAGGGGPNPVWIEGRAGVYYSVLNGLFEGHKQFDITIGDKCVPAYTDPFSGIDIVYETYPTEDQTDVSPFVNPTASFILPIDESFTLPVMNDDGSTTDISFKLNLDQYIIEAPLNNDDDEDDNPIATTLLKQELEIKEFIWDEENKQVSADFTSVLDPFTSHDFIIKLKGEEKVNGSWVTLKDEDGKDWFEKKEYQFTTGNMPYPVPDDEVSYCFPARRHQYFLQDEVIANPFLINFKTNLKGGQTGYFPEDDDNATYKYWLRFQDLQGGEPIKTELVDIENQSVIDQIQNVYPELLNSTIYSVQLLRSEVPKIQPGQFLPQTVVFQNLDLDNEMGSTTTVNIDTDPLDPGKTAADNEAIIYQYYFKTSQYNTLAEKVATAEVTKKHANSGNEEEDYPLVTLHLNEAFDLIDIYGVMEPDGQSLLSPRVSSLVESDYLDLVGGSYVNTAGGQIMDAEMEIEMHVPELLSSLPTHKGSEGFFDYCTNRVDDFYEIMDQVWEPEEPYYMYTAEVLIPTTDKFAGGNGVISGGNNGTGGQNEILSSDGTSSSSNQNGTITSSGGSENTFGGGGDQSTSIDIEWNPRRTDPDLNFHPDERPFQYYFTEFNGVEGLLTDGMINGQWNAFQKNSNNFNEGLLLKGGANKIIEENQNAFYTGELVDLGMYQMGQKSIQEGFFEPPQNEWNFSEASADMTENFLENQYNDFLDNTDVDIVDSHPASLVIHFSLHPRGVEDGEAMADIANDFYSDVLALNKGLIQATDLFFEESVPIFWDNYGKILNLSGYHYFKHNGQYPLILQPNKGIGPEFMGGSNYSSFTFTKY